MLNKILNNLNVKVCSSPHQFHTIRTTISTNNFPVLNVIGTVCGSIKLIKMKSRDAPDLDFARYCIRLSANLKAGHRKFV